MATVVRLDLVVIQASVQTGLHRNLRFRTVGKTLRNIDSVKVMLTGDGVVGLHLQLPGTGFDVIHRAIDPMQLGLGEGDALKIAAGDWTLNPPSFATYEDLTVTA